jgi:hypothetical protein
MKSFAFWDVMPHRPLEVNYVSEEHNATIFRVKDLHKYKTSRLQAEQIMCQRPSSEAGR